MKQFFQKNLSKLIFAILILFAAFPASASTKIGDLYYNLYSSTHTAEVTYYSYSSGSNQNYVSGDLIIPESITYNSQTYSVISIGSFAFDGCISLTSISIPNSVVSIDDNAFYGCTSLAELIFEDGDSTLELGRNISSYGLFSSCPLEKIYLGRNLSYPSSYSPFANQKNLNNVTIGNQVTNLREYLFYGCSALTSITIPYSVKSIGNYAFYKCTALTNITIPDSVTSIGNSVFDGCTSLAEVTFEDGDSTLTLGYNSSYNGLFGSCPLEKIYLGRDLSYSTGSSSGYSPFANQKKLTDVTIGNQVTTLGSYLFYKCSGLPSITIPNSVNTIGSSAFSGCKALTTIFYNPSDSFATLKSDSFVDVYSTANLCILTSPEKTFDILDTEDWSKFNHIFYLQDGKKYVPSLWMISPVSVQNVLYNDIRGFLSESGTEVILKSSDNIVSAYRDGEDFLEQLTSSAGFSVIPDLKWWINSFYISSESEICKGVTLPKAGELFNQLGLQDIQRVISLKITGEINGTDVMTLNRMNQLKVLDLSDAKIVEGGQTYRENLKTATDVFGSYFLSECRNLECLTLPATAKTIDSNALNGNASLRFISIPASVTEICDRAFYGCSSIKVLTLEDVDSTLKLGYNTSSKNGLFSSCPLEKIYLGRNLSYSSSSSAGYSPFANQTNLTYVTIGNQVTKIGSSLFYGCNSLITITIPNSVTSIESSAFQDCNALTSITIPNSVTSIGNSTFNGCSALTSITIPKYVTSIAPSAFQDCSALTSITIPNSVTEIWGSAFDGCTAVAVLTIEDGEKTLKGYNSSLFGSCPLEKIYLGRDLLYSTSSSSGYSPFANQKKLTDVTIGNQVTKLGKYLFYGCKALTNITIPNSVTSIEDYTFESCNSLTNITIPNSVTSIGGYAFHGCSALTSITIPNSITSIGDYAFYECTALTRITIPNSVTSIGNSAFRYCLGLTGITIPNSLTSIGDYAFSECSSITTATLGISVTSIGYKTFYKCTALTNITIPHSVTSIGSYAFSECSALTNITIPNSVTSIGNDAFYDCTSLTELTIEDGDNVLKLGYNSSSKEGLFSSCPLEKIYLGGDLSYSTGSSSGYSPFANQKKLTDVTIGNQVKSIDNYLFYGCTALTNITIPNSVTSMGNYAFRNCNTLKSIKISDSVTSIGQYTFSGCTALTNITIPDSVTSIGYYAFYNCSSLESLTLGTDLKSIGDSGFSGCTNLSKIYSLNPTPPEINNNTFNGVDKETCQLIVTKGNLVYYWLDPVWKEFLNISDDLLYLSPLPSVKYGDAPVNLADYAPEGYSFVYETSNSDVARLDGSILTIVGAGEATIGASYRAAGTPMEILGQMRQFIVDKADLAIGVQDVTIEYGEEIPQFKITVEGLVYGETLEDVGELPVAYTDATDGSAPGVYPILWSGGESPNYNFKYTPGTLTILERGVDNIVEVWDDNLSEEECSSVKIFNMDGIMIYDGLEAEMKLKELKKGIYIVVKGNSSRKIIIR